MKPMPEPAVEEDVMFDGIGDIGEPPMEDELGGMDDELGGIPGEQVGDDESVRKVLEGLVGLVGADQVRQLVDECCAGGDEALNEDPMGGEEMLGEESLDEPLGDELGGPPEEMAAEMPSPMAAPAPMSSPMPSPMPSPM